MVFELAGGGGGQKPLMRGLHLTCDAHFRTRMSYSSQKSCVKILLGLAEIGGMLIFEVRLWAEEPLLGGLHVTCDAHFQTCLSYFSQKSRVKIWFGLLDPFKSYRVHKQTNERTNKHGRDFLRSILIWAPSMIFFFCFIFLFVSTITLESLNQSEPNFHTWLLSRIARASLKMGITGHM